RVTVTAGEGAFQGTTGLSGIGVGSTPDGKEVFIADKLGTTSGILHKLVKQKNGSYIVERTTTTITFRNANDRVAGVVLGDYFYNFRTNGTNVVAQRWLRSDLTATDQVLTGD